MSALHRIEQLRRMVVVANVDHGIMTDPAALAVVRDEATDRYVRQVDGIVVLLTALDDDGTLLRLIRLLALEGKA